MFMWTLNNVRAIRKWISKAMGGSSTDFKLITKLNLAIIAL